MTPQFTYDNKGNAIGVFLPIEDWNQLKSNFPGNNNELPEWQKDMLDHRMKLLQENAAGTIPLEDFINEMQKEADAEV